MAKRTPGRHQDQSTHQPRQPRGRAGASLALAAAAAALTIGGQSALAASGSWLGTTDATWADSTNWDVTLVPGPGETATFNSAGNGNTTIDLGAGVTVSQIAYDGASAVAYTIGSGGVGTQTLTFDAAAGNSVTMNGTVTTNQFINANVLANNVDNTLRLVNSSTGTNTLTIAGTIESGTAAAKTITTTGNVNLNGAINPGLAASISVANAGAFGQILTLGGTGTSNLSTLRATNSGTVVVDGQTVNVAASSRFGSNSSTSGRFDLRSGAANFNGGITTTNTVADGTLIQVSGGAFTATSISLGRTSNPGTNLPTTVTANSGLVVIGGTASVTGNVDIGTANSSATALVNGGSLTVGGQFTLGNTTNTRYNVLEVRSGSFTSTDATNGVVLSTHATTANRSALLLTGGTSTIERLSFGDGDSAAGSVGAVVLNGGTLYLGSGGLVTTSPNAYTSTVNLTAGTLGAKSDWSSSLPMNLNGSSVTIKAANAADEARNITLSGALSGSATINKTGGGILTLSGTNFSGLTPYSGNIVLNAGGLVLDQATNGTYNGVLSGAGSLTKAGAGTLTLNTAQTYTGATTVAGGTLAINGAQSTSGVTVNSGATLALAGNATVNALTLGATAGDTQTLRVNTGSGVNGLGVLTTDALVAHGLTTIDVGSIGLSAGVYPVLDYAGSIGGTGGGFNAFTLGSLPPRVAGHLVNNTGNTSIDLNVTGVDFPRWTGAADGNWDIGTVDGSGTPTSGTANWKEVTSGNTTVYLQASTPGDQVVFDDSATGPTSVNIVAAVSPALVTVNNATKSYTFTGAKIGGPGQLIKQGTGSLTVSNAGNDYTGGTTLQDGTLQLGAANALPTAGRVTVTGGTLNLGGLSQDLSGLFELDGGAIANGTVNKSGANYDLRSGAVSANLAGAVGLNKSTAGTVVLTGTPTYTGATTVAAGTLQLGDGTTLGSVPGNIANSGTVVFNNATDQSYSGSILGFTGAVVKNGTGTLTLTGVSLTSGNEGNATVNAGTVVLVGGFDPAVEAHARLGRGGSITINSGATVLVQNANALGLNSGLNPANFVLNAGGTLKGDFGSNTAIYNGTFAGGTLSGEADAGMAFRGDYTATAGTTSTVSAPNIGMSNAVGFNTAAGAVVNISSNLSGGTSFGKQGDGTVNLSGTNTYTGATAVEAGTLSVTPTAIPTANAVTVNGGSYTMAGPTGSVFRPGTLTVNGGQAEVATNGGNTLAITHPNLTLGAAGKLNMRDNDLIVDYTGASPEGAIRQLVKDGRANAASGIVATPGNPDDDVVLAIADNAAWGKTIFNNVNIDTDTVVGKYTYFGDANLDGKVTGDDYLNVDANLGTGDSWLEGDFNMSGVTTGDDYLAIDANLGKGTANPLAFSELKEEMVAAHVAMFGEEYLVKLAQVEAEGFGSTVVPEPAAVSLIGFGALGLLGRRRRRA